ncbi:helix-turn-helix domain-containing protein [Bacteroides sp.]
MMDEIHATKEIDHHVLRAMLYETLMLFNRAETTDSNTQQINLAFAIRYIDSFAKQANLDFAKQHDVEYYADKLCITSNYLNKIVRQSLGVTTKIYIRNKIISEAKRLLIYTTMSVTEITDKLHFESDSYFIRYFRKYVGVTPIQYRKQESK